MSRIAFFGLANTVNFHHIGGLDSLVRRLSLALAEMGDEVELIHYGAQHDEEDCFGPRVVQRYFQSLGSALQHVRKHSEHVVSFYLLPRDRPAFARFRRRHRKSMTFHHLYSVLSESGLKKRLLFADARISPFNGRLFCISPRLHRSVAKWTSAATLLLPPVPADFFCQMHDRPRDGKLRVLYAGRLDPAKGVCEAEAVFHRLADRKDIETMICGYAWDDQAESVAVHERLLADRSIVYDHADYRSWSPVADEHLRDLLRQADVLLLPYRRLSSTIDMPLLLLEAMASLCAVITPDLGDLKQTYGDSCFALENGWDTETVVNMVEDAEPRLETERRRLTQQNTVLRFDVQSVAEGFQDAINENGR